MTSSDIVALFRSEMGDSVQPYLWSDTDLFGYLDEAQSMFARKTDGIADARTVAVTQISIVPSTEWYATHPSILFIRKCTRADTGQIVELLTVEQAQDRNLLFLAANAGTLRYGVLGFDAHSLRAYPMPNETVTLNLAVYRLPLVTITDAGDQALEIDAQHHPSLIHWMKHRAYLKQDAETLDRNKAAEFETMFDVYCAKAKLEQNRARRVQGNVVYGGIPMGPRLSHYGNKDNRYSPY